jgi:hypothetical protein
VAGKKFPPGRPRRSTGARDYAPSGVIDKARDLSGGVQGKRCTRTPSPSPRGCAWTSRRLASRQVGLSLRTSEQQPALEVRLLDERGTYVGVGSAARGDVRDKSWERAEYAAGRW